MRTRIKPRNIPKIPTIEANSDGAGIGSFKNENTAPAISPVTSDLARSKKSICIRFAERF